MITQDLALLPLTVYGTPSGNYDGSSDTDFAGERQKAVNYYRRTTGTQSVRFQLENFDGAITIQATLDADPTQDAEWFDVYTLPDTPPVTTDVSIAIKGNFTWMRAHVQGFVGGTITSVTITY
jgi:hypothetical protein